MSRSISAGQEHGDIFCEVGDVSTAGTRVLGIEFPMVHLGISLPLAFMPSF